MVTIFTTFNKLFFSKVDFGKILLVSSQFLQLVVAMKILFMKPKKSMNDI